MLQLSFFSRFVRCASQCKSSCRMTPNWMWLDCLIFWPLTWKLSCLVIFLFLGLNNIISVLLAFSDSLLALIQSTVSFKSLLICLLIFLSDLSMRSRFVSAKWCTELNSTTLCRSLRNKIKRRGPRTDPWGMPYLIGFSADLLPWTLVNCFLSSWKDWNHLLAMPLIP